MANQPFLGHGGHQPAGLCEDAADGQPPSPGCTGALHGVEQPVVHSKIPVKPHGMVQAGHLHVRLPEGVPVGIQRGAHQIEIGCIGQQVVVDSHLIRQGADSPKPDIFFGAPFLRFEGIDRVDVADLDGLVAQDLLPDTRGDMVGQFAGKFYLRLQPVGTLDRGHVVLVVEARLVNLERSSHGEDGPAFLNGHHPPGGEAFSVPDAVHGVGDRSLWRHRPA